MNITDAIRAHHDALVETMLQTADRELGTSDDEVRQFIVGFVNVLSAAAAGDLSPRDEYLTTVIPAIRDGGMPLVVIVDGMLRVSLSAAVVLEREHLPWLIQFCSDYTKALLSIWEGQ
jgi:hypothetical protein